MSKETIDLWQVVGGVAAVIAIFATILVAYIQKKRKRFSYIVFTSESLLRVSKKVKDQISVQYKKKAVKNLHLLILKFSNSGNQPILSSDFEMPIKIGFTSTSKILSVEIENPHPENLPISVEQASNVVEISRTMLNPKDSFDVKMLISDFEALPNISGRIVGVPTITSKRDRDVLSLTISLFGMIAFVIGGIGLTIASYKENGGVVARPQEIPWLILVGISAILLIGSALTERGIRGLIIRVVKNLFRP